MNRRIYDDVEEMLDPAVLAPIVGSRVSLIVREPLETEGATYRIARELLAELRTQRRTPARLLGVGLTNLGSRDDPLQFGFFEEQDRLESPRERALGQAVDGLRERFGDGAVLPGRIIDD